MDINTLHSHRRDAALTFIPDTHTYIVGGTEFESVTTVVENCFESFDADYWAERKATPGRTAEMIKAEWAARGEEARRMGTLMHERIERYYLGHPVDPAWMADGAFSRFAAFAWKVRLCPFRTEWRIYHEESRLAGTLDFLAACADGSFEIWDWKRSNKVVDSCGNPITDNSFGRTALTPLDHLPDTTFWHYALQVSIYRYILEAKYDMRISGARLGIFHPQHTSFFVALLPYLRDEVKMIINQRIKNL